MGPKELNIQKEMIVQCYANRPVSHIEKYVWNAKVTVNEMCCQLFSFKKMQEVTFLNFN